MEEHKASTLDRFLRPLGGAFIIGFGLLCIILSFLIREPGQDGDQNNRSFFGKILFSAGFVENWFYDMRTSRFYNHGKQSPNIVIVEIDDQALNKIGRWPWTRTQHAKLIENLGTYGARTVMFDVTFPEPESELADKAVTQSISKFVQAGDRRSVILGYDLTKAPDETLQELPMDFQISAITGKPDSNHTMKGLNNVNKYNFAAPLLISPDTTFGFISAEPDTDGVFRHARLLTEIQKAFYPSLGFAGFVNFYADGKERKVMVEPMSNSNDFLLQLHSEKGVTPIILNSRGEMRLRYFGGLKNFVTVNVADILLDPAPAINNRLKETFQGKAVLLGSSAFGAHDLRHTPVDPQSPGMILHANLFHALDQHFFFQSEDVSMMLSLALFIFCILGVLFFTRFKSPLVETLGSLGVAGGVFIADYTYFAPNGYLIRLFFCLTGVTNLFAWYTILNVFKEAKEKRKIRDTFSRYVAPDIVKEMLSNPDKLKVGGEKREITMLFSDVRDFTTISERLTPQELSTLLNIYMGKMTDILFETHGTLDKYIGDAMVGFWGAPVELKDHAYHGVRGAVKMLEHLPPINEEFKKRKFPKINVGIGINTGDVSVGNMGSDKIFQYTALGDNMNLASRLESLTKYYGVNLMISEFTLEALGTHKSEFKIRSLDLVRVKGKSKAVKIFEVLPSWSAISESVGCLEKYEKAYQGYLQRDFSGTVESCQSILAQYPEDKPTQKLLHNAEECLQTPPAADWDGSTNYTTK